jgi:hypothetical protein
MTDEIEPVREFTSEDDLETFEGWLKYQGYDATAMAPDNLRTLREHYETLRQQILAMPKVGRMKLSAMASGEYRYGVAVRDDSGLWLTLCARRRY